MYIVKPESEMRGRVLVLHAWWGLTPFFCSFCDRLAQAGYLTVAPDLFDGRTANTIPGAEKLRKSVGREVIAGRLLEGWEALQAHPAEGESRTAVIGFSLGAYWTLWLAEQKPADLNAVVLFYGMRGGDYSGSQAAYQGHFAETDSYVAGSGVKKLEKTLRSAGRQVEFYTYPGTGHWFCESNQPAYDVQAAGLAWERTLEFLGNRVG
jgi:carboxymethylenebutenolidase